MKPADLSHIDLLRLLSERSDHILRILKLYEAGLSSARMADTAVRDAGLLALMNARAAAENLAAKAERSLQANLPEALK